MKKFLFFFLVSCIPLYMVAQPLAVDIHVSGISYSTWDLCIGDEVILTGVGSGGILPYSYTWAGGGGQLSTLVASPSTFTATSVGTYVVTCTVTDGTSSTATDNITITVNPLPNLFTFPGNPIICLGDCINLSASTSTGDGVIWYEGFIGGTVLASGGTNLIVNVCPTVTTDYYAMSYMTTTGCVKSKKVTVTVVNLTATATAIPNPICLNDSSQLQATPIGGIGPNYTYVWDNASTLSNPNIANPWASPLTNTTYTVTITDLTSLCTATANIPVTVNPQQPPVIDKDTTLCFATCVNLTATGSGTIFDWSTGQNNIATINVCPIATTVYTVTMTDGNGCTATNDATVTVNPLLTANAGTDKLVCFGNCTNIGFAPNPASGGSAPYTYSWTSVPAGYASAVDLPSVCPTVTTTYTLTVTDAAGCTATDAVIVTANPQLVINAPNPPPMCVGGCVQLGNIPVVTGGTPAYNYNWSPATGLSATNIANPTACPASTTAYTLSITDAAGCTASQLVTVTINPKPVFDAGNPQTTCSNQCVTIGGAPASGGTAPYIYAWSSVPVSVIPAVASPSVCPTVTTTYTVAVTDVNGCSVTDNVTITVNPAPTANAGTPQTMCIGTCIAIGGSPTATGGAGGYIYSWSPSGSLSDGTIANPTACPLSTTTYCVTVTDALGCTASNCVTITVNTVTATAVANPSTVCNGACSDITATGGGTYLWCCGLGTNATVNVCPTVTTIYTVTVTATNGCTAIATAIVTVVNLTEIVTAVTNPICPPGCTNITATPSGGSGNYTYQWSAPGGTTPTINVCPTATTIYTCTVTDATNLCTQSASVTVTVYTATASASPANICNGGCTLLTATSVPAGGTFQWCCGLGNTPTVSVCPTVTTTYTVTVTNGGCISTASVIVNITTVTATATPTTSPLCLGQCTIITASGSGGVAPYTYNWSPAGSLSDPTLANPLACPANTTTYTVTITDANGCTGTASATVNVITVTVTGNPTSICPGGTAMLIATGGPTYNWCCGLGTNDTVYVTPAVTTTYTVTVTVGGCTASAAYTVTVNALTVTASANPTTICSGGTTPVTLSTAGGGTYLWSSVPADPSLAGQTALQNPIVTPTQTTTYTATVTNSGCTATASVTVTVAIVTASISASPSSVCSGGCTTLLLTISGGQAPYTYSWNTIPAQTTSTIIVCPLVTTTYICTITDVNGCSDVANITVTVLALPPVAINPSPVSICSGGIATLTASGGINCSWTALPPDPSLAGQQNNCTINVTPTVTTSYCVTVTGANGCTASSCAIVNVTTSPNAVVNATPNTICSGANVNLTATGGSNYQWSSSPFDNTLTPSQTNTQNPVVAPTVTTTYTVTVTQAGCTAQSIASIVVTVNQSPIITLSSSDADNIICSGDNVTFTVNGVAANYNFYINGPPSVQSSGLNTYSTTTLTNPSSIYVIATNGTCPDTSNTILTNVNPVPTINIVTVNQPSICGACDGSIITTTMGGTSPYTYQWNTSPVVQITPNATNLCAGSYSVIVTDQNSCSDAAFAAVSDPGSISVTLTSSSNPVCTGSCVTYTATSLSAVNYEFTINGATVYSGPLNTYNTCSLANGDVVIAGGTDASGCTGFSNQIIVVVNPLPTAFNVTGGGQYCQGSAGSPIILDGSQIGVNYYLYNTVYTGISFPGTNNPINFGSQSTAGTYCIIAQNVITGCQNNMTGCVPVSVNPLPNQYSVTGGGTFCGGGAGMPVCLNGSNPGIMYQLLINGISDTTIVGTGAAICFGNQNVTGTYCVTATNTLTTCSVAMLNCVNVTASPIPTAYTVTGGGNYCTGGIGVLIGISGSDPGVTYQVLGPGGPYGPYGPYPVTGSAVDFIYFTAPGVYTVTGTNGSCSNTMNGSVTIAVNPSPTASAGNDTTICQWSSATLNGSGAGVGGTYLWAPSTWLVPDNIANPVITPQATITYFLTVTDMNGCTASDNIVITVNPFTLPVIAATDTGFCTGDPVLSTLSVIPGPPAYASYLWSNGDPNPTTVVNTVGCYTVIVTAANGCSAASPAQCIQMYPPMPPAVILENGPKHFCQPDSVMLYMNNPYYTFEWSSGSINVPSIYVAESGYYSVTVTDSFGCVYYAGPDTVIVDPLPQAIISYVDRNDTLTFDFYSYSLHGNTYSWAFGDPSSGALNNSGNEDYFHEFTSPGTYTVMLTVSNNCGTDVATAVINVHPSTNGIGESPGISDLVLYPNPARDLVNIDFTLINSKQITITMFDALSQQMYNESLEFGIGKHHKEIDISTLPRGIYFFKIASDDGIYIEKLVKN